MWFNLFSVSSFSHIHRSFNDKDNINKGNNEYDITEVNHEDDDNDSVYPEWNGIESLSAEPSGEPPETADNAPEPIENACRNERLTDDDRAIGSDASETDPPKTYVSCFSYYSQLSQIFFHPSKTSTCCEAQMLLLWSFQDDLPRPVHGSQAT